jgi:hypothetical protein
MRKIPSKRLFWAALFLVVTAVLVALLVLIGLGYLTLPKSSPASVTVSEIEWTILQGNTSHGMGWFGPSTFTYSNNAGFPRTETVGQSFELPWSPENFDTVDHFVYTVSLGNAGYCFDKVFPALPHAVAPGDDGGSFEFAISIPSSASGTVAIALTVNALTATSQSYCS